MSKNSKAISYTYDLNISNRKSEQFLSQQINAFNIIYIAYKLLTKF